MEESPEYADLSAVWGEKGRSPYFVRHPVGKRNELVCCSQVTGPVVDLYTIPFGNPSWRLMRYSFTDIREMRWWIVDPWDVARLALNCVDCTMCSS